MESVSPSEVMTTRLDIMPVVCKAEPQSEEMIKENMLQHRDTIISCLNPAQLLGLFSYFDLDKTNLSIDRSKLRSEKAMILYQEVVKQNAYHKFLSSLEEDTEHMGHRYIVSLLRGAQFAGEEEIRESEKLREQVQSQINSLMTVLDVNGLVPQLTEKCLLTGDELDKLNSPQITRQNKVRFILTLLKTKGPTAYSVFFKCLKAVDKDLCELLTNTRKRKFSDETTPCVSKRAPHSLDAPKGLRSKRYLQTIAEIREGHQTGGDKWKASDDLCDRVISSQTTPLEIKVALLLEGTITFIFRNRPEEEIFGRVELARRMCLELSRHQRNAQALEGRCEFILAKYYKCRGDYEKAQRHLDAYFRLIAICEPGEDTILANYNQGLVLLQMSTASDLDREKGINYLKTVITLANGQNYGLKALQYGSIRLAQAQIGSSSFNLGKPREELSAENIQVAKSALEVIDVEKQNLPPRTKCMYLYTLSDVLRLDRQLQEATKYVKLAMNIAQVNNLCTEMAPIEIRLRQMEILSVAD